MVEKKGYDLKKVLEFLDPGSLSYSEWLAVGMGLSEEGYTAADWDEWSRRDAPRYHSGECEKKWRTFRGNASPTTAGTIVQMAMDRGWRPADGGAELGWTDIIGTDGDELVVVQKGWLETREIEEPKEWDPAGQLIRYLETLFEAGDNVGYVTRSWEKEGRFLPTKGCYDRTAGQLIEQLSRCKGDIGAVLGDYDPRAGAWIRFNPLDGKGVKNDNVSEFRYALIESDAMEIAAQNAIIRELELPVAALVHSGGKSLHAIVRIDAANYGEYRQRVDYLYAVCQKNGLELDSQNRNPSRLSRMPGVLRNGKKQFLVDTNLGKRSWEEWKEWIEAVNDDLPEPESIASVWNDLPALSPPLIEGVLRQGHKMLLAGPSKAGKSYALIELCIAIAEGRRWLSWQCAQGKVLYVNLELDRASCLHRFRDVYGALGWRPEHLENLDVWNLRGRAIPMDKLAPKLIRRAAKKRYTAIVIDPIYKVITGDENSADQMARFCNQFDLVCTELGCAVIYCHHHSKGSQGQKRSMDRASGSGVFARDPDALLDLIELDVSEDLRAQERNKAVAAALAGLLREFVPDWEELVSRDDLCSQRAMRELCLAHLPAEGRRRMDDAERAARERTDHRSAWRIEGTLREFPGFPPVDLWFDYPVHRLDQSGSLSDIAPETDETKPAGKAQPKQRKRTREEKLETAFAACDMEGKGEVSFVELEKYTGLSRNTLKGYVDGSEGFTRSGGIVRRVTAEGGE